MERNRRTPLAGGRTTCSSRVKRCGPSPEASAFLLRDLSPRWSSSRRGVTWVAASTGSTMRYKKHNKERTGQIKGPISPVEGGRLWTVTEETSERAFQGVWGVDA